MWHDGGAPPPPRWEVRVQIPPRYQSRVPNGRAPRNEGSSLLMLLIPYLLKCEGRIVHVPAAQPPALGDAMRLPNAVHRAMAEPLRWGGGSVHVAPLPIVVMVYD
jgi:hypothetical protein